MRTMNRFIALALMWMVGGWILLVAFPGGGVAYAQENQCKPPQRRCTGRLVKGAPICYTPGDDRCLRGRVCKITERLCEGHLCKPSDPNCKSPFRLQRHPPVECYDPKERICNVSSRKGAPTCGKEPCEPVGWFGKLIGSKPNCPEVRRRCKGLYGDRCYYPGKEICTNGRTCPIGRRSCESSTSSECYNPDESVCLSGNICKIGEQVCRGRNGAECFDPKKARCFDGIACGNGTRLCSVGGRKSCQPVGEACSNKK